MIGGRHIQRGTNRVLTDNAFFASEDFKVSIFAIMQEGDYLLDRPDIEFLHRPAHDSHEDVVVARVVRYVNDTKFGEGKPPENRFAWMDCGP